MKETVAAFVRRTGERYDPPPALRARARALAPAEACPTLFRYPGPEGLRSVLDGSASRLAPSDAAWLWLAHRATATGHSGPRLFGAVALLEPLRLQPCRLLRHRGAYLAVNREVREEDGPIWVPPSAMTARLPWDRLREPAEAVRRVGRGYAAERSAVRDALGAYLEELSALAGAGAPSPARPWCDLSAAERRRLLARYGVESRWTPR